MTFSQIEYWFFKKQRLFDEGGLSNKQMIKYNHTYEMACETELSKIRYNLLTVSVCE